MKDKERGGRGRKGEAGVGRDWKAEGERLRFLVSYSHQHLFPPPSPRAFTPPVSYAGNILLHKPLYSTSSC